MKSKSITLILSNLLIVVFLSNAQEKPLYEIDANRLFFPVGFLLDTINPEVDGIIHGTDFMARRHRLADFRNKMYSESLSRLNEPTLIHEYPNEVYRFTWFGYLGNRHNPLTVRIENHNGNVFIVSKYISRKNNGEEELVINDTVFVDDRSWAEFANMIDDADFWGISPIEKTQIVYMDGSIWILEGRKDDLYHAVFRSMGKNKETGDICLRLLYLSNLKLRRKQFY